MGNILTDLEATYKAIDVLSPTYVDADAHPDTDADEWAIAEWATEVRDALFKIKEWFEGTSSAGKAGTTVGLLGGLSVSESIDGKILHPIKSCCYSTNTSLTYLPMVGVVENTGITNYDVGWMAPHDGELVEILWHTTFGGGSTVLAMHKNENTTPSCSQTQSVSASTTTTFDTWTGTKTFNKGDLLHFSWNPTTTASGIRSTIKVRLDTNT